MCWDGMRALPVQAKQFNATLVGGFWSWFESAVVVGFVQRARFSGVTLKPIAKRRSVLIVFT